MPSGAFGVSPKLFEELWQRLHPIASTKTMLQRGRTAWGSLECCLLIKPPGGAWNPSSKNLVPFPSVVQDVIAGDWGAVVKDPDFLSRL